MIIAHVIMAAVAGTWAMLWIYGNNWLSVMAWITVALYSLGNTLREYK